jgi:hypothetical protein
MGLLGWITGVGMGGGIGTGLHVWAATGTKCFQRTQAAGSGTTVTMKQGRNERRWFQILARAGAQIANLDIATAALSDGDGNSIAASNITLHRGHQIQVTTATHQNQAALDADPPETLEGLGWYPGPLIPTVHPVTGDALAAGKTYQALPYTLPADQTHTFLVDIYTPKTTVPGTYTGTLTVSADDQDDVEISVSLEVWNWGHDDTPALRTALWSGTTDSLYANSADLYANGWVEEDVDWEADVAVNINTVLSEGGIAAQPFHTETALDFRPTGSGTTWSVSAQAISDLQTHIDTYHPSTIFLQDPRRYGGPFTDAAAEATEYAAWITAYDAGITSVARTDPTYAVYTKDEPNDATESQDVIDWGTPLYDGGLNSMVTTMIAVLDEFTGMISMIGAVNIWAILMEYWDHQFAVDGVTDTHTNTAAATRVAAGDTLWLYTATSGHNDAGVRPYWPHHDRPLLNCRLAGWLAWEGGMTGLLYWGAGVHWWTTYDNGNDPWTDPETHIVGAQTFNGEGVLWYPADADSVGFYGIVPSMQSFALRDGIFDHNYLHIANAWGLGREADAEVEALITSFASWNTDPDAYETAREKLGAMLHLGNRNALSPIGRGTVIDAVLGRTGVTDATVGRLAGTDASLGRTPSTDDVLGRVPATAETVGRP